MNMDNLDVMAGSRWITTLDLAIERIRTFHEREKEESWTVTGDNGIITGRLVNPIDSAGLYVPGGQGGPLMHMIAAKALCFKEAMKPEFKV